MKHYKSNFWRLIQKFLPPLMIILNCVLSFFGGIKIGLGKEIYAANWLEISEGTFDAVFVLQLICLFASVILAFLNGNFSRIISFLTKLVPITCLLKMVLIISNLIMGFENSAISVSNITFSALGWLQIMVIVLSISVSIFADSYIKAKEDNCTFAD